LRKRDALLGTNNKLALELGRDIVQHENRAGRNTHSRGRLGSGALKNSLRVLQKFWARRGFGAGLGLRSAEEANPSVPVGKR
jgi:hypothetical protein